MIPVIILSVAFIFTVAFAFIMKVHYSDNKLSKEKDLVTSLDEKLDAHVSSYDTSFSKTAYIALLIICPIALGIVIYLVTKNITLSVIVAMIGVLIPELLLTLLKNKGNKKFNEKYMRALEQLSSSLRSGSSIAQAVEDVASCKFVHESMRKKFAHMAADLAMGLSVEEAFWSFAKSTKSEEAHDIALSISIQDAIGGHEADVVNNIVNTMKDRLHTKREIKSMFAGTSAMVWIMDFICPACIIFMVVTDKTYIESYFSSPILTIVFFVIVAMPIIGSIFTHYLIRKIERGA